jgi:putative flippase GtrA
VQILDRLRGAIGVLYREMIKFGVVGAVAFVVDMGTFNLLLHSVWRDTTKVGPMSAAVAAAVVSAALGSLVAWIGNRTWTFRHRRNRPVHHEAGLFFATNGVALVIGAVCVAFSNKVLGLEGNVVAANVAKLVGIALGTLFRFWAYRRFVFAGEPVGDPEENVTEPASS